MTAATEGDDKPPVSLFSLLMAQALAAMGPMGPVIARAWNEKMREINGPRED